MMQLGQAAGTAAAIAEESGVTVSHVPSDQLRAYLREQHVQLEWPLTDTMRDYLLNEETP